MGTAPFFIVGSPRSGTTLLRFILSSHPRLYVPDETGFLPSLGVRPDELLDEAAVARLLARIGRLNRFWAGMVDDVAAFYRGLPEARAGAVLDALYRQRIAAHGAERWGDKTPPYILHIPLLAQLFPGAQFIHLIRDGRDATVSAYRKWGQNTRYMDHYYLLRLWVRYVSAGRRDGPRLPAGQYLEIRYESLVREPERVVQAVCAFLGESYLPAMLDQTGLAAAVGGGIDAHVEVQAPISSSSVGRWSEALTPFQQKLAARIAGPLLADLAYAVPPVAPFSAAERARYLGLAAKFALIDNTRTALYRLGILSLNRNRRA